MEELKHNLTSRCAHRNHLKKLVTKVTEATEQFNSSLTSKPDNTALTDLREQLLRKQTILTELDAKISPLITDEEELEREIIESEDYCSLMSTNIARVAHLLEACRVTEPSIARSPHTATAESRDPADVVTSPSESPLDSTARAVSRPQDITRLPIKVEHSTLLWKYPRVTVILGLFHNCYTQ